MNTGLIQCQPNIMMGKPVIAGTRITVEAVLEKLAVGETVEQLLEAYPRLTNPAILAALEFAARALRADVIHKVDLMNSIRRKKWADALQLRFAQALIATFSRLFRLMEHFGPEKRRRKLREFRARMQVLEQEKRTMLQQIDQNPRDGFGVVDDFINRHADFDTQQQFAEHRLKIRIMQEEGDALQAIRTRSGENTADAIAGYRQYIEAHPNSQLAHSYLGGILQKAQDWDGSLAVYREAERLAGDNRVFGSMARLEIGRVLQGKGDLEAAVAQYRSLIAAAATESEIAVNAAYLCLGNALLALGKRSEARAAWKQAAKRDSTKILAEKAREMLKANP